MYLSSPESIGHAQVSWYATWLETCPTKRVDLFLLCCNLCKVMFV
jgi:hypothetical protein